MVSGLVGELQGKEVRTSDMLALNDRGGNAFLLFLSPQARRGGPPAAHRRPRGDLPARERAAQPQARRVHLALPPRQAQGHRGLRRRVPQPADHGRARRLPPRERGVGERPDPEDAGRLPDAVPAAGRAARRPDHDRLPADRGPAAGRHARPRGALARTDGHAAAQPDQPVRGRRRDRPRLRARPPLPPAGAADGPRAAAPYRLFVNVVPASMYDPDFQGAASSSCSRASASRRSGSCSR